MKHLSALVFTIVLIGCGSADAEPTMRSGLDTTLVISADPELRALAAELLPELSRRAGLELVAPVRLERRSRAELERYLRFKLDEELPQTQADYLARSYHLLGLAPDALDLRALLLSVYQEQVAGFYDPDSTALFVMDDQGPDALRPLLLHELVHAVQDQSADLDALTAPELGNDRRKAAQAAIEGHATLVMMEQMFEELQGQPLDLSEIPDMAAQLRPALDGIQGQFPALAAAPAVVQESLLFPYLEGAGYVLALWRSGESRGAAFEGWMPRSTEQVMDPERILRPDPDEPTRVDLEVGSGSVVFEDDLGQAEVQLLLREHAGANADAGLGWDGDRYALVSLPGGGSGLAWASVWDEAVDRDRFVAALGDALGAFPLVATLEALEVDGRPVALLRVGLEGGVAVRLEGGRP